MRRADARAPRAYLPDTPPDTRKLITSPLAYWRTPYLFVFFVFGALWIYAFVGLSEKPRFLRRAAWMVPIFVAIHLAVGVLAEVRQMLPLAFILIPLAFFTLFPAARPTDSSGT